MSANKTVPVPAAPAGESLAGQQVTEHVWRCPDGVYRWYHELSMLKNPIVLFTTWKVLGVSFGVVYLIVLIANAAGDPGFGWGGFLDLTWIFVLLTVVIGVIAVLAYLVVAACYGWKYVVLFEMDDEAVRHIQVPRQFKKAQALAWLTMLAGAASGSPTAAGAGLLAATRNSTTSAFAAVRRVAVYPKRGLIKLDQTFNHNQIYAAPEDFGFVREHIVSRCTKAKVRP